MFSQMLEWQRSALKVASLAAEAQQVVAYRTLGMAGLWSVDPSENVRMVTEKSPALMQSWWSASRAAMGGAAPERVVMAWAGPLERKARSNRKRLAKRGPNMNFGA
ncbi:hypothetical protein [Salipiger bermudensis]|uniref:Antifreeze protein, type I n=1 Tax=Salipiger bermudensis (strain DSM 26914 / JCM 13377 / KCTC 12554 / HTCC2601) TaxID=314265 RepID=Q0FQX8_SALBH|nr:hypothetical protein [Salipiger bermudensis]MAE89852.1 antifreeze protein [Pelagibaca sp.]MBR9892155.1 antifreeze protein [bacterium]EAU46554.1 Antifreeze protein, type I [Salipiger bermudensis HTCC2601]MBN9678136.1 antifreeze protein [Salipiger bermudensis]MCA1285097.1 antifreeze protein [Salipiger bermudensis]